MAKEMLGVYYNDYEDIFLDSESNFSKIYRASNIKENRDCCLKIISLEELKKGDYDFHIERLKKEEEITRLCNSKNTVNLYRKLQTEKYIIFELENCEQDLAAYLSENGELVREKKFFIQIVRDIANAMKTLNSKGIIHRDIKPSNMFICGNENNRIIKLGDFGCATYKNENNSDQIGTYLYSAPEVTMNLEYDDKCDLWSLGISFFELFFGLLPYAPVANSSNMLKYIYGDREWIFRKTKDLGKLYQPIPNLDVFFRRLLTIEPEKRMSFYEFFNYVSNKDFMNPEIIAINNNQEYMQIYQKLEKEPNVEYNEGISKESHEEEKVKKENATKIVDLVEEGHLPDIMNFQNGSLTDKKFNNIIYYDENIDNFKSAIYKDSDLFERNTSGAFILCVNLESFRLIREEILKQKKRDKTTCFNLITNGSQCDIVIKFIK